MRDDLRSYVLDHLADPAGVVVADETGFLKKGIKSAGVQRQYSGTAGRIENCQLGVFLTYVSARGRALIDRELYLPKSWTDDPQRCAETAIGDEVGFATKPELAQRMLKRLLTAGQCPAWFTADEAYGDNPGLRSWLEDNDLNYVMAISCDQRFTTPAGPCGRTSWPAARHARAGNGCRPARAARGIVSTTGCCWIQARTTTHCWCAARSVTPMSWPITLAYYICHTRQPVPVAELVRVAGSRWGVEETFQFAKNENGLDHYQVRKYQAWYRHVTLSILAAAFLAVTAHTERDRDTKGASRSVVKG